ncbi:MAG: hypothetical protein R3199_09385 [Gemmatimonadota bacterium]|nr:hypothetical protein [Gemmatimonadota bacterium]
MARLSLLSLALLLLLAAAAHAQAPPDCSAPEHRQFDFWIGEWEVFDPEGEKVGENTITAIQDGCALREEWESVGDHAGTSLNFYDRDTGRWYQTWIANNGNDLHLTGGLEEDGTMVMESLLEGERRDRITWIPADDGSVRQVWDVSIDGGETWKTGFEGRYVREGSD